MIGDKFMNKSYIEVLIKIGKKDNFLYFNNRI